MRAQPAAGFLVTLGAMDAGISTERPVPVLSQVLLVEAETPPMLPGLEGSFLKPLCRVPQPKSCYFNNLTQSTSVYLLHQTQTFSVMVARPTEGPFGFSFSPIKQPSQENLIGRRF